MKFLPGVVCVSLGILSVIALSQAILAWTNPTDDPPLGTGIISSSGGVLQVDGQLKITGGTPGTGKVLTSDTVGLATWDNVGGGACAVSGNDIVCSGIPASSAGALSITKNAVTCPIWKDCDGDGKTYGNGDCDESCATCYVGLDAVLVSADNKDNDCDGVVDEVHPFYALYVTNSTFLGNLGGRTGADAKCNADANKALAGCSSDAKAFISVTSTDEIRDFPTTWSVNTSLPWWWAKSTSMPKVAVDWADLLDGTILASAISAGFTSGTVWSGSGSNGSLAGYTCTNFTSSLGTDYASAGDTTLTTSAWISSGGHYCNSQRRLHCVCARTDNYQ